MANGGKRKKIISNHSLLSPKFSSSLVVVVSAVSFCKAVRFPCYRKRSFLLSTCVSVKYISVLISSFRCLEQFSKFLQKGCFFPLSFPVIPEKHLCRPSIFSLTPRPVSQAWNEWQGLALPGCNKEIDLEKCIRKIQHNLSQKSDHLEIRRMGTGKQLIIQFQEISFKH